MYVDIDSIHNWSRVGDLNFYLSVLIYICWFFQVQAMKGRGGLILNIGSAAGLYPMQFGPIYSASKGLSILFHFPNHVIQTTSRSDFSIKSEKENDINNLSSV
jgi:hypothetical protein